MKYSIFFSFLLMGSALPAYAHVPLVVTQDSLYDITTIEDPELSQAFYGSLADFPHTYEIRADEPFHLYAEVLVPDIESTQNIVNGIVVRATGQKGRVEEVARLLAKDATWESFYEPWGGDTYRKGAVFEKDLERGVYRIEVSTPDNRQKYVLVVGKREDSGGIGYFETIGRIADVKTFFGKSKIRVIESPLVYIPLLLSILLVVGLWYWRRRKKLLRTTDASLRINK